MSEDDERLERINEAIRKKYEGYDNSWGDSENPDYVGSIDVGIHHCVSLDCMSLAVIGLGDIMGEEGGDDDGDDGDSNDQGCGEDD